MKIIITQDQLNLIDENYRRDRFDAEYSHEYPNYKKLFIKMLKSDVDSSYQGHQSIQLKNKNGESLFVYMMGSKTLYYNYSLEDEMEDIIPSHIRSRHIKHAVYDYFKKLFPDVVIKEVSGANIG
jgi:hypothetical protein